MLHSSYPSRPSPTTTTQGSTGGATRRRRLRADLGRNYLITTFARSRTTPGSSTQRFGGDQIDHEIKLGWPGAAGCIPIVGLSRPTTLQQMTRRTCFTVCRDVPGSFTVFGIAL